MSQVSKEHFEELEQFIDAYGLASVLAALADIASEKADHINSNWQDAPLAKAWDKAAITLGKTAFNRSIKEVCF